MTTVDEYREESVIRVEQAIRQIKAGGMVIMTDDEDRENEGDLVCAAEHATPEIINFMAKEARGLICLSLDQNHSDRLGLKMMEDQSKTDAVRSTAFTLSIEAREGVTTGISAADRSHTILTAIKDNVVPQDIVVPGHVFPIKAKPGGVLERAGHTEGSVDIAQLAGCKASGVICEIMNDDGTMARMPDLIKFAEKHELPIVTIEDIIAYRLRHESLIELHGPEPVVSEFGELRGYVAKAHTDGLQHFILVKGENFEDQIVDVRVHMQNPLVDVFGKSEFGRGTRMNSSLEMLRDTERGVLIYLTRHTDTLDLAKELVALGGAESAAKMPQDKGKDTRMDLRQIGTGAQILRALGVKKMRVHTASTRPIKGASGFGLEIVDRVVFSEESGENT